MTIFAPGVAQGVNAYFADQRKAGIDAQLAKERSQLMELRKQQMDAATLQAQYAAQDRSNSGIVAKSMLPPPVSDAPPVQTPAPGQPSVPMVQQPASAQGPYGPLPGAGQQPAMVPPIGGSGPAAPGRKPKYATVQSAVQPTSMQPPIQGAPPPISQPPAAQGGASSVQQAFKSLEAAGVPPEQWFSAIEKHLPMMREDERNEAFAMKGKLDWMEKQEKIRHEVAMEGQASKRTDAYASDVANRRGRGESLAAAALPPLSKETIDYYARQSLKGDSSWQVGLARGKVGQQLISAVKDRVPVMAKESKTSPEDAMANTSTYKAGQGAVNALEKQYQAVSAFQQTASRNGAALIKLAEKVDETGVPAIERWIRAGRRATGSPDVREFDAQMQIYRTEAAKILTNPNLTGQLTDSSRHEVEEFLGGNLDAASIKRVIERLESDFSNRTDTLKLQIDSARNKQVGRTDPPMKGGVTKPYSDADKEARYQAWKAKHANE